MKRNTSLEGVSPRSEAQKDYIRIIRNNELIFSTGPAGTGKTFICAAMAAQALHLNKTGRIIVTRPCVEAEEKLGYLPGELDDKTAPYFQPFKEALALILGYNNVVGLLKSGRIEVQPLAYMRGRTFENCWCILDEAQNATKKQLKLFLTRIGENSKVIVNGDTSQTDIGGDTGLLDAVARFRSIPGVGVKEFTIEDCVRSRLAKIAIEAYEKAGI